MLVTKIYLLAIDIILELEAPVKEVREQGFNENCSNINHRDFISSLTTICNLSDVKNGSFTAVNSQSSTTTAQFDTVVSSDYNKIDPTCNTEHNVESSDTESEPNSPQQLPQPVWATSTFSKMQVFSDGVQSIKQTLNVNPSNVFTSISDSTKSTAVIFDSDRLVQDVHFSELGKIEEKEKEHEEKQAAAMQIMREAKRQSQWSSRAAEERANREREEAERRRREAELAQEAERKKEQELRRIEEERRLLVEARKREDKIKRKVSRIKIYIC